MRVIDKELVQAIPWGNDHDLKLSQLSKDGQHFIVVNPELDYSVLDLITVDVPLNDRCVKYKIGDGWIAKRFPGNWNGQTQIVQLPIKPVNIHVDKYVSMPTEYVPDAWDLKYTISMIYDKSLTGGEEVDAVLINYLPNTEGKKIVGTVTTSISNKFDVVFLSNGEPEAEANWQRLLSKYPDAKHVSRVKGILNAHKAAAAVATTDMFWVVDADAYVADDFDFTFAPYIQDRNKVHIWYSHNPVNDLEYGYGGVKLFPRQAIISADDNIIDVSTSLGDVRVIETVACETRFNVDAFNTWKSAFRECAKLSSKTIKNQNSRQTEQRLEQWLTVGSDRPFGQYAIAGAIAGKAFGSNPDNSLYFINNYEWLTNEYNKL